MHEDTCSHCYRTYTVHDAIMLVRVHPDLRPRSFCQECWGTIAHRWERRLRRYLPQRYALAYVQSCADALSPLVHSASERI